MGDGAWNPDGVFPRRPPYERRYEAVQQRVRQYRPSLLLPALAAYAANPKVELSSQDLQTRTPWAIAALAKESLVRGNEHRPASLAPDVVPRLVGLFNNAYEPPEGKRGLAELLAPIAYEQIPYQEANYADLARTRALFVDTALPTSAGTDVAAWTDVLGISLDLASQATFILWVLANQNAGRLDLSLVDTPDLAPVLERVPREAIALTAARLTATVSQAKADYGAQPKLEPRLERFAYNPLRRTPFIELGTGAVVAPQPALIPMAATPSSLYYVGAQTWGKPFLDQLGARFEAYVGRQLMAIDEFDVRPEVVYGKPERRSVDWIVIAAEAVLLIECKLGRPVLEARSGADGFVAKYAEKLDLARRQINDTVEQIAGSAPGFAFVPQGRPLIGIVVTFEEFFMANDPEVVRHLREAAIPTLYASVKDLESLLTLDPGRVIRFLLELVDDTERSAWSLGSALVGESQARRNPVLEQAWASLDFLER